MVAARRRPVLLVEDNHDLAEIVHDVLVDAGYEVVLAADADEALDRYCDMERNCLVLLDMHLPSAHGDEVLHRMVDLTRFDATVVAVTGSQDAPADVAEVLRKPFDMKRLLELVGRYCD